MKASLNRTLNKLLKTVKGYNPNIDLETIKAAFEFAKVAHAGEKRLSGVAVIWHPLQTAIILASWGMDKDTILAGLLHDTIEHGAATSRDILSAFGKDVLSLVEGITKTSQLKLKGSDQEFFVENLRKMFLAIAKDLRIVFLRLAERIDNLRSLQYLPEDKRKNYAKESLEIYAPLAERMGMWSVKTEIDELAFKFADPISYRKTKSISKSAYRNAETKIGIMSKSVLAELKKQGLHGAELFARKKNLYSLYSKLKREEIDWDISKVHDIIALRILVNTVSDCYVVLGFIHQIFKPVPDINFSDFISVPKPNGYRSIHTKVYSPGGDIVEVQIRTFKMHQEAEYGAAAHWQMSTLKSSGKLDSNDIDSGNWSISGKKLNWVRQLSRWQKDIKDNEEFLKAVKFDALSRRIFVFSPKGDVFDLPEKATPVDYAFAVHSDLGSFIKGAKVNGKIVSLNYIMNNGEMVEIMKTKNPSKPNSDWLKFVATTQARKEIKKQLKEVK